MIRPARGITFYSDNERSLWLYPTICLVGYRLHVPVGESRIGYEMEDNDFISGQAQVGDVMALNSATIIVPGGEVLIRNDQLDEALRWEGSLKPIANGIHVKGNVTLTGIKDSVMHCVSPRNNLKGFHDKYMERIHLSAGETIVFGKNIIGFVVVYGEVGKEHFPAYFADEGDSYTASEDAVLAVAYRKEIVNEDPHP